jgi:hypothetical protein
MYDSNLEYDNLIFFNILKNMKDPNPVQTSNYVNITANIHLAECAVCTFFFSFNSMISFGSNFIHIYFFTNIKFKLNTQDV